MADLSVNIASLELKNPLMTASGTCGYSDEYGDFVDLTQLGAFVTKSISLAPRIGNPPQRVIETRAGMLNAIGLANVGLEKFVSEKLPLLEKMGLPVIVNVAGSTIDDYLAVTAELAKLEQVDALELNISCPNVKEGGIAFGVDPAAAGKITAEVKALCGDKDLIVKLSPNVTDITAIAAAAIDNGADALSMVNTFTAMVIDVEKRRPMLANNTGGLSGPAIHPIAVHMVHQVYSKVAKVAGVPIIAMGGVQHWRDAVEFLIAGATGIAIGTSLFVDPRCIISIRDGINDYLDRHNFESINDIIGTLELN